MMKKFILSFISIFLLNAAIFGQINLYDFLSAEDVATLERDGVIKNYHADGNDGEFHLMPPNVFFDITQEMKVEKNEKNFPFVGELLYKISKKELAENGSGDIENATLENASKIFRSISEMKDMKYFSSRKNKEMILYKDAYTTKSETDFSKVNDRNKGSANALRNFFILEDASFGVCKYKARYFQNKNTFYSYYTNTDYMKAGPIKAIAPGDIIITVLILDNGDDLLFFLASDCSCIKFPNMRKLIEEAFDCRLTAMFDWLSHKF